MRAEPVERSEQTSQVILGETVRVLREEGGFAEIQSPDGYQGWTPRRHLRVLGEGERYPDPARAAMVAPLFLPVFRVASGHSERITLLTLGTAVELGQGDADAEFYPIRLPAGETGYVEAAALIVPRYPALENLGPNLAVVAKGLIGVPYWWGGRTPFGMDCSGIVQRVYWLCGQVIPRDAYLQDRDDRFDPVERDAVQAGDLLFFQGDRDPRSRGITHVGMALGDGRFIHASGELGVAITTMEAEPYVRQFRSAGRLVR
jgi:hypothetical protein